MSETLIYLILFALLMFFMHRGHGSGMGCHGGHSHQSHEQEQDDHRDSVNHESEHHHH